MFKQRIWHVSTVIVLRKITSNYIILQAIAKQRKFESFLKKKKEVLAYATGPFIKGLEGIPRWGGIHNQSYLQFQIRYRNRFGIVRKRKIRAFKCSRFQVFILSGTGDIAKTPQNRVRLKTRMKKDEIKQELQKRGIPYKTNYLKPQLLALLEENIASTSTSSPTDHTDPEQQYESEHHREVSKAYHEVVFWRANLCQVPSGKTGKDFVHEVANVLNSFNKNSQNSTIAIMLLMLLFL